jgi:hypothetical protein
MGCYAGMAMHKGMSQDRESRRKPTPWRDNSSFVATFYAILTAMVGAILALAIGDEKIKTCWYWPVGLLSFSMVSLIWGLEKCGEATDEDDVDKYLAWLLAYNSGTIAMFFGIAAYVVLHYQPGWTLFIVILLLAALASWKWLSDIWFLLFVDALEHGKYRDELLGNRSPEKESDPIVWLYGIFRRLHNEKKR